MKNLFLFFFPLILFSRVEVGRIAVNLTIFQEPIYETFSAKMYALEEESYLVLRPVFSKRQGKKLLQKFETKIQNLQWSRVKMASGLTLEVGVFLDPFLYSWVVIGKVQSSQRKHLVSLLFFREDRASMDYFSFMEGLKILAV